MADRGSAPVPVLRFEDRAVEARADDTVSSALLREDVLATSRSPKYRRARGPYCLTGDCGTCLVRVDGRPNVRACLTPVRDGMQVRPQNTFRPDALDPTRLVDAVFRKGLDHHHLMVRPRIVNQAMQTFARTLTGLGEIPDPGVTSPAGHRHRACGVLIVGAGASGRGVASTLREHGVSPLVVERLPASLGRVVPGWPGAPDLDGVEYGCAVFGAYGDERWVAAASDQAPALHTFAARHVVVCAGAREPMPPLEQCDLPGVVAALGLLRTMAATGFDPSTDGRVVALVGEGDRTASLAEAIGATVVLDLSAVVGFHGRGRVRAIETRVRPGGKTTKIAADLVAIAPALAPAHELAVQLGAAVAFDGLGFAVQRDAEGRCGEFGDATVWAAGRVCGTRSPEASFDDGCRVANNVLAALRAGPDRPEDSGRGVSP